ncbi:glycosyltransferase family 2 protein [Aeromonas veronii]|uniref:glycosyltransferase family 2 protein n=1 Tax=Aeromonas veronii TaxID=654 RepID=UPI003D238D04
MLDICFCVVLYNKDFEKSQTLTSLRACLKGFLNKGHYKIVIFNNGPKEVVFEDSLFDITVNQVLINGSLSKIYNKTIDLYKANKYVFLDDDTEVNDEYLSELISLGFNIFMPKIHCQGIGCYPIINHSGVQTITSGLAISNLAVDEFKKRNCMVFDESFDLYGIDTALCYVINKFSYQYTVSQSYLEHQLSHISGNTGEFRKREVLLSNSAALIKYFNIRLLCQTGASALWAIKKLQFKILYKAFLSFLACRVIR